MEKREYTRVYNQFNVRIAKEITSGTFKDMDIDVAQSINISAGGLLVATNETVDKNTEIRVTFLKPNTFEFFEGRASVKRTEKNNNDTYTVAIEFHDLTAEEKKRLNYYINLCN